MKTIGTFIFILTSILAFGQDKSTSKTSIFIDKVKNYDFSVLWTLSEFQTDNGTTTIIRKDPLGYIGDNYQRFYIHFISVIQNPKDKYEYFVYGKTRVKDNICEFQGSVKITGSLTYDEGDAPNLKQGFVEGEYEFFENSYRNGSGALKGIFKTDFYIDEKGNLKYDALNFIADGFSNNQFEGTWTSYKTGGSKKCNWGDYRIPDSNELDFGAGEFGPGDKFDQYGWLTYRAANRITNKMDTKEAIRLENEKWWTRE